MNLFKIYCITMSIAILIVGGLIYAVQPADNTAALAVEQAKSARVDALTETPNLFPHPQKTNYQMSLYLDINKRILRGTTLLNTENTSGKVLNELWFTTYPNAFRKQTVSPAPAKAYYSGFDEGWLEFGEIKVNGKPATHKLEGVSAQVNPAGPILPNQSMEIEMQWTIKIPKAAYRFGTKDNVLMLGNFYPLLNVLSEEWHISYNSRFGDPFCFHSANYLVRINTPENYQIVATGTTLQKIAEDDGRQTHLIKALDVRDFSLAVLYNYAEISQTLGNTQVNLYLPQNNSSLGTRLLAETSAILKYYSQEFGSYPYPYFNVAFVPMEGFQGMEYSGLIFLRDDFLQPNYDSNHRDFILAHEIAHQWWYGMVGNDQIKEPWLDEGLANWSAYKCLHNIKNQPLPKRNYSKSNLAKGLKDCYSTSEYYDTAYSGGEAFWFSLEKELGTDTVIRILKRYLFDFKYKIATSSDLFTIINEEAPQEVDSFLAKWYNP